MSVVLIDQQIVHYEVLGRGRPTIFLHGWAGSWRYWVPVMQAASTSYRAYALDLWGFGDTSKNKAGYGLKNQVILVDRFLYEMGIGRVALVGHGLGAIVAILYALEHPEMVDRVMAVSYPVDESCVNTRMNIAAPADLADWLAGNSPVAEPVRTDALKTDPQAISRSLADLSLAEVKGASMRLSTSCLLVNGFKDQAVTPPDLDTVFGMPQVVHAVNFEQSGHFPMLDEGNKFNRLLVDFLSLASGESPRQLQLKEEWKRRVR